MKGEGFDPKYLPYGYIKYFDEVLGREDLKTLYEYLRKKGCRNA